ncbi:hypothetical protein [Geomonas anaerohicana]|uniref:Mannitol repressor n=1 Tax=Geomonas anaerohicana TaxID=2798583 RepID=A0ABS0YEL2_9BACT|nr:hypothetical protein [Geomonas anaerohicana]MBJ6750738.1 hypothetical protein [Geomonas anaerohicana]
MSLTDVSKIVEWGVGVRLDRVKDIELILLKGHLMLEVGINHAIRTLAGVACKSSDFSFHRKLHVLENYIPSARPDFGRALVHLRSLNKLRNRLAHELTFEDVSSAFGLWSDEVLADFPGTKVCRNTFRTKIIRAIGALITVLIDPRRLPEEVE